MLHSVDWWLVTDVSGEHIDPIFRGQGVQEDCLTLEDGTERLSRNVGNCQLVVLYVPEEQRPYLYCSGNLNGQDTNVIEVKQVGCF